MVRASFTFAVPNTAPRLSRIQVGDPDSCGFDLFFECGGLGSGSVGGVNAQDTALVIADAINASCSDPSLVDARANRNIVATVYDKYVTLEFDLDAECCGTDYVLYDDSNQTAIWQPLGAGQIECQDFPPELAEIDCTQYPPNQHIFRFAFKNLGTVFGASGTDWRYTLDHVDAPTGGDPPDCTAGGSGYYVQLSTKFYPTEEEFYDGWAQFLTYISWLPNYGGSVTHLGNGVMEVVTDIATWTEKKPLLDICAGLIVQCRYDGVISDPSLEVVEITQGCCIEEPETPPPSPDIEEPPIVTPPTTDPKAYDYLNLDCCPPTQAGGIVRVIVLDRDLYQNICLDALGQIESIVTASNTWLELCLPKWVSALSITEERSDNGLRFIHVVDSATFPVSQTARNAFLRLGQRPMVAILEDAGGTHWFMGEYNPVRLRNIKGTTGTHNGGGNGYTFQLLETSRYHLRKINQSFIDTINVTGVENCGDPVPEFAVNIYPKRNCFIGGNGVDFDFRNNFINT